MLPSRLILLRTASESSYALLVLITIVATGLSCAALLSQAVRTAPSQSWGKNVDALVIGASYAVVASRICAEVIYLLIETLYSLLYLYFTASTAG